MKIALLQELKYISIIGSSNHILDHYIHQRKLIALLFVKMQILLFLCQYLMKERKWVVLECAKDAYKRNQTGLITAHNVTNAFSKWIITVLGLLTASDFIITNTF